MVPAPLEIAHRGYSAVAPENTVAAFRAALDAGARAAECDVRCTADGHVVLLHDAALDRTTDGSGPVTAVTLEELRRLDAGSWKSGDCPHEHVPTLAEVLELTCGRLHLVIEIKQTGVAERVLDTVEQAGALGHVSVISFDAATCRRVRELAPTVSVGWLTVGLPAEASEQQARGLLEEGLAAHVQFLSVAAGGLAPSLLRCCQLAGISLWAWTVNEPGEVRRLASLGVAAITTDDPATALAALAALASRHRGTCRAG